MWYRSTQNNIYQLNQRNVPLLMHKPHTPEESSMVELEASLRPSMASADLPDLVGNMWNTEGSLPDIDTMGRYVTSWNSDYETPTWNRYSPSNICKAGVKGMTNARFPSKTVEFS